MVEHEWNPGGYFASLEQGRLGAVATARQETRRKGEVYANERVQCYHLWLPGWAIHWHCMQLSGDRLRGVSGTDRSIGCRQYRAGAVRRWQRCREPSIGHLQSNVAAGRALRA